MGSSARFNCVTGLLCHPNGTTLFVADNANHRIRKVDLTSRSVTTIAGDGTYETRDGTGVKCSICTPRQLVFDRSPNVKPNSVLLISSRKAIRRFDTETGVVTTLKLHASTATGTAINPSSLAHTPSGHMILSCDDTHSLYLVDPSGAVLTIAGTGKRGFMDGTAAAFEYSAHVFVSSFGADAISTICSAFHFLFRFRFCSVLGL